MAKPGIPEFLFGQVAPFAAFVVFLIFASFGYAPLHCFIFANIFMILALQMVQMKPGKTCNVDQESDVETGLQKTKKKRSHKVGKFARFFVGEPLKESRRDESPYELDDEVWMAPENAPACIAAQQMEAYDLPDHVWSAPFITVEGHV